MWNNCKEQCERINERRDRRRIAYLHWVFLLLSILNLLLFSNSSLFSVKLEFSAKIPLLSLHHSRRSYLFKKLSYHLFGWKFRFSIITYHVQFSQRSGVRNNYTQIEYRAVCDFVVCPSSLSNTYTHCFQKKKNHTGEIKTFQCGIPL